MLYHYRVVLEWAVLARARESPAPLQLQLWIFFFFLGGGAVTQGTRCSLLPLMLSPSRFKPQGSGSAPWNQFTSCLSDSSYRKDIISVQKPPTSSRKGCFTKGLSLLFWGHPSPCPGPVFTLICLDRRMGAWTTRFVFVFDGRPQEHWLHVLFVWLQFNSCSLWNNPISAGFISLVALTQLFWPVRLLPPPHPPGPVPCPPHHYPRNPFGYFNLRD